MPTPTQVTCPTCQTQLDLTGLSQIPPQVRCGQCGTIFGTQDAEMKATPRQRWRGEDEATTGSSSRSHDDLLPPGAPSKRDRQSDSSTSARSSTDDAREAQAPSPEPFDPTPPHLRAAKQAKRASQSSSEGLLPVASPVSDTHASTLSSSPGSRDKELQQAERERRVVNVGGVSLQVDEDDLKYRQRPRESRINAVWVVAGLVLFTVIPGAILAVIYLVNGSIPIPGRGGDIPISVADDQALNPTEIHWSDASRYSARLTNIKVKVERAEHGEVRARTSDLDVQSSEDESFFQLSVNLLNQRSRPVTYTSWYGNEFEGEGGPFVAELKDDQGRAYPMLVFRDAAQVQGHTPGAEIGPNRSIRDTIVFEIPPDVDLDQVKYFRLSLPAAAFAERGALYFEIPRSMLRDARQGFGVLGEQSPLESDPEEPATDDGKSESDQEPSRQPPVVHRLLWTENELVV